MANRKPCPVILKSLTPVTMVTRNSIINRRIPRFKQDDVNALIELLLSTLGLSSNATPADIVCKLQLKIADSDPKINDIKNLAIDLGISSAANIDDGNSITCQIRQKFFEMKTNYRLQKKDFKNFQRKARRKNMTIKSLRLKIKEAGKCISKMEEEQMLAKETETSLTSDLKRMEGNVSGKSEHIHKIETEHLGAIKLADDLKAQLEASQDRNIDSSSRIDALQDEITRLKLEKKQFESQLKEMELKLSHAESDAVDSIREEKNRTDEVKKEMALQIEHWSRKSDGMEKLVNQLEKTLSTLEAEKDEYQQKLQISSEKLTEKAKSLQDFEKIYFEMEQEYTDLRSIQKKLEIEKRLTGDKMEEMKGTVGKTLEKKKGLMIQLDSAHQECLEMEREIKKKSEEQNSLQKRCLDITHENERLSNQLQISSDKLIETSKRAQEIERKCSEFVQENGRLCYQQKTFHRMLIAAGISTGLITSDEQDIDIGMIVQSYQDLQERCSKLELQVEDGMISSIISPSDGQGSSEKEALRFKIKSQDLMITKLRYSLSMFQQNAWSKKGSLETSDVPVVDRAVLTLIPSEEIPTVMESQLEPWDKEDTKAIGKGTFGVVFLKRLESDPVAVKVQGIHKGKKAMHEEDAKRAMSLNRARTMKEVAVLRLLEGHPAFPRCHGYTKYASFPGLVLEFLGDKTTRDVYSLSKAIKTKNPVLSDQERLSIVVDVTEGIHAMHERDLLHNDIKPNNVLLHRGDRWKAYIIDMGNVTTVTMPHKNRNLTNHEMEGYRLGVVYQHLAPEYILDGEYSSIQSDIFSLGRIIHYISRVIHNSDLFNLATLMINSHPHLRPSWKDIIRVIQNTKNKCSPQ